MRSRLHSGHRGSKSASSSHLTYDLTTHCSTKHARVCVRVWMGEKKGPEKGWIEEGGIKRERGKGAGCCGTIHTRSKNDGLEPRNWVSRQSVEPKKVPGQRCSLLIGGRKPHISEGRRLTAG